MEELRKNQTYTATIESYSSTGAGVCRINGRAVFVPQGIVGEVWEILILKVTSKAVFAKGINLIEKSKERIEPLCSAYSKCGGCQLMHMSYEEELKFKLQRVNDALKRLGKLDFQIEEIIAAYEEHRLNYRNKAIYAVNYDENKNVATGFYKERSHELIATDYCHIQTELSNRCASVLREFLKETNIPPYNEVTRKGQVRHLFTRCSVKLDESVLCLVSTKGLHEHTQKFVDMVREKCPEITGIVLCINKSTENTVLNGEFHTLWGNDCINDELLGLKFKISPLSFYQINPRQTEKLYTRALEYASPDGDKTVLDLYCGAGTITLALARGTKYVYGAEIVEPAVLNARQNCENNGIKNAEFLCADAGNAAKIFAERGIKPETIVVDPPRKGLSPEVIEEITKMKPENIVYVSCDSATLARDLGIFKEKGYKIEKGTCVDMFPRTCHVECVCLMSKIG